MHYTNRFARTPRVKYIFSHAGGSIPYLAARFAIIDEMGFIAGGELRGAATDMFQRIYWDTARLPRAILYSACCGTWRESIKSWAEADLTGLPPIRIRAGDDEVLLDDSRRYAENAVASGVDAKLDLWMGMPHGFVTNVGRFTPLSRRSRQVEDF